MERIVAVKKLGKMLGKGFGYRIDTKAPDQEGREAAKAELVAARAERDRLKTIRDDRYAVLMCDPEYQARRAAWKVAQDKVDDLQSKLSWYKITVGNSSNIAGFGIFHVKAQGDNWEEVIEKLQSKS